MVSKMLAWLWDFFKEFLYKLTLSVTELIIFLMRKTMKPLLFIFACEMIYVFFKW